MKRYQNPDIFESLAMAYALGTLQGQARQRYESLMDKHFYLRAVTEAYERQFMSLAEAVPSVNPPESVWQRLEAELQLPAKTSFSTKTAQQGREVSETPETSGWFEWLRWPVTAFASVMAAVVTMMVLQQPEPTHFSPDAYVSKMMSDDNRYALTATVLKDDMEITVASVSGIPMPDGHQPTLWCLPKNQAEAPMRMGTLASLANGTLKIDKEMWRGLKDVREFAVSLEPMDQQAAKPMGEIMYRGRLKSADMD